jgi:hypothetical protein
VRAQGIDRAAHDALAHLERADGLAGLWIHLDADDDPDGRIARALVDALVAAFPP